MAIDFRQKRTAAEILVSHVMASSGMDLALAVRPPLSKSANFIIHGRSARQEIGASCEF